MSALPRLQPSVTPPTPLRAAVARFTARHPEWWVVVGALAAWAVLLASAVGITDAAGGASLQSLHAAHRLGGSANARAPGGLDPAAGWLLMVIAMMGPVMVPRMRHVAACCVGRSRTSAMVETLVGALTVWLVLGLVVVGVGAVVPALDAHHAPAAFAGFWLLAAGWQVSAWKLTALGRCHAVRVPRLIADGRQRLSAGLAYGGWCLLSCWPAMTAMALTGHSPVMMAVLTFGLTAERVVHRPRRAVRRLAAAIVVVAALSLLPVGS